MIKTSNQKARQYVQDREAFKGSNTFGEWVGDVYAVYSYGYHFPMFAFKDGNWYANSDKYSVSTSKQYGQLHPHTDCTALNTQAMKYLIGR